METFKIKDEYIQLNQLIKAMGWVENGFAIFLMLQFNEKVLVWGDEVVVEIKKVVWPSQKDVTTTTTAVIIMVVISSLVISSFDVISAYVLKFVLGQ